MDFFLILPPIQYYAQLFFPSWEFVGISYTHVGDPYEGFGTQICLLY